MTELGVVSLRELLNEWAAHDMMHIVQAERAIMQPFIAASGPWRALLRRPRRRGRYSELTTRTPMWWS